MALYILARLAVEPRCASWNVTSGRLCAVPHTALPATCRVPAAYAFQWLSAIDFVPRLICFTRSVSENCVASRVVLSAPLLRIYDGNPALPAVFACLHSCYLCIGTGRLCYGMKQRNSYVPVTLNDTFPSQASTKTTASAPTGR